ncbi:MAG: copper chaperone [Gemmatimonadales bacterium]|nr:MAG: copper chaperone [Gemmatimonadales bacterium]
MKSATRLELQGMSCQHCVRRVRETLESLDGVTVESVDIGSAEIQLEPGTVPMEQVEEALRDAGYAPR